jgi:uncharacterized protein (DUF2336 family)
VSQIFSARNFRALENASSHTRKDEIVLAAVNAFASRTRPTRLEAGQVEDLVLATLDHTSAQTRRLAAACLSHVPHAPLKLVLRLCEESADICAPLLLRSPVLQDADLIALVEKNGVDFARIIARRLTLTQKLKNFLLSLGDRQLASIVTAETPAEIHPEIKADPVQISAKLEAARDALRAMMREQVELPVITSAAQEAFEPALPAADVGPIAPSAGWSEPPAQPREPGQVPATLRRTALMGDPSFFITALADAHGLSFERAKRITGRATPSEMIMALHAAGVTTADAFIIVTAFYPSLAKEKSEIALFLIRYEGMVHDQSLSNVRRWKAEEISQALRTKPANTPAANPFLPQRELKAG